MVKEEPPTHGGKRSPYPFTYYVFASQSEEPTEEERRSGIYLVGEAEARHLQQFFDPLYEGVGIGISTSDDEAIAGETELSALLSAIEDAIRDAHHRPSQWPITIGYKLEPFQREPGPAIVNMVSRSRLVEFLEGVGEIVRRARDAGEWVYFCGGG